MTSLLATRRRAEAFARLVEGSRRSHDPNVAPLLELVAMLRPAGVQPSEGFRTSLRDRLLAVAAERPQDAMPDALPIPAARSAVRTPTRLRVVAVAVSVALAGGMVGTAAAARHALPGEFLYTLKRGLEQSEAAVTTNSESRGRQYLGQATTRLTEISSLTDQSVRPGDTDRLALSQSTLDDFAHDARQGGNLLVEASQLNDSPEPLVRLREFVAASRPQLELIREALPAEAGAAYSDALAVLDQLDQRALELCPQCKPGADDPDGVLGRPAGGGSTDTGPAGGDTDSTPDDTATASTEPGSTATGEPAPEPTRANRHWLQLPLPWPIDPRPGPTISVGLPGPPAPGQGTEVLAIPLPNPTSLPLPLPAEQPQPASLPLELPAEPVRTVSLPWLLPGGIPEPLLPTGAPQPAPTADPSTSATPTPGPTPTKPNPTDSPTPGRTELPSEVPPILPSPDDEETPTSGGSIFDDLFGPLLPG
ncbi:DUF5667 domain-containing protein [Actinopolymorpha sp. B17G11]|uniref:DUF5667 domain-containing protein n=1 Tax=Actinopolymorpha sp. B17G11 TaxID=3160861 RepID=UPI0032E4BC77